MSKLLPPASSYRPLFFSLTPASSEYNSFKNLQSDAENAGNLLDLFAHQKKELLRQQHPRKHWDADSLDRAYEEWAAGKNPDQEGTWVYYPWSKRLLHLLEKEEFIQVRTSRNQYKITPAEQQLLSTKTIGIIGLSVGHAVALTLASERIAGNLKLADFDTIELSNLNRIRTGIHSSGLNKCIVTAREIAEIDPFIDIECFTEGITPENLETFLRGSPALDLLIDECDDLQLKIRCRQKAREYGIPVLMETSDRGMLDVERYDLEPERALFHGLLNDIPAERLQAIAPAEKIPLVLKIVNAPNGSVRGRASMIEIGQTISTWPQLASAVTLGGSIVAETGRRILLDTFRASGRYYVDPEQIIRDKTLSDIGTPASNPYEPFDKTAAWLLADSFPAAGTLHLPEATVKTLVDAACQAPSTGNDQPWKWIYTNGNLLLFHDPHRSHSFGDFHQNASFISLGAAYENLSLKSRALGYDVQLQWQPSRASPHLVALLRFIPAAPTAIPDYSFLSGAIYSRCTNRNTMVREVIPEAAYHRITGAAESIEGVKLHWLTAPEPIQEAGRIIGACDRIRLLHPEGHQDFVGREMRWTPEEAETKGDGIDIRSLGLSGPEALALGLVKDPEVAGTLKKIEGGHALVQAALKTVSGAAAIGLITLPEYGHRSFFEGGKAMQRLWLQTELEELALHPLISPLYLFPRILYGTENGLDETEIRKLRELRQQFLQIFPLEPGLAEVFLFKIGKADRPLIQSHRLPLHTTLFLRSPL